MAGKEGIDEKFANKSKGCKADFDGTELDIGNKRFSAIEFPFLFKNGSESRERAFEKVGGIEAINEVHNNEARTLDLRMQKNPLCHPISADRQSTTRLLMRVKRRRRQTGNPQACHSYISHVLTLRGHDLLQKIVELEISIEGRISTTYAFTRLADAQFITREQKAKTSAEPKSPGRQPGPKRPRPGGEPIQFIPIQFLRNSNPQKYSFQRSRQMLGLTPGKRNNCPTVVFHQPGQPAPTSHPSKEAKDAGDTSDVNPQKAYVIRRLLSLLEKKPVWQRVDIMKSYGRQNRWLAKECISVYTYIFGVGPWRNSCIRFGYDPYSDPHARFYQSIEFRLTEGQLSNFREKYKLSCAREGKEDTELIVFGKPIKRQNRLAFQHMDDYEIQQFILHHPRQAKVDFRWGWFTSDFDTRLRKMIYENIDWNVEQAALEESERERKKPALTCEEFNEQAKTLGPLAKIIDSVEKEPHIASLKGKKTIQSSESNAEETKAEMGTSEQDSEETKVTEEQQNEAHPIGDSQSTSAFMFDEDDCIEAYQLLDDEDADDLFEEMEYDDFEEPPDDI